MIFTHALKKHILQRSATSAMTTASAPGQTNHDHSVHPLAPAGSQQPKSLDGVSDEHQKETMCTSGQDANPGRSGAPGQGREHRAPISRADEQHSDAWAGLWSQPGSTALLRASCPGAAKAGEMTCPRVGLPNTHGTGGPSPRASLTWRQQGRERPRCCSLFRCPRGRVQT